MLLFLVLALLLVPTSAAAEDGVFANQLSFEDLDGEIRSHLAFLERETGRRLGDPDVPGKQLPVTFLQGLDVEVELLDAPGC